MSEIGNYVSEYINTGAWSHPNPKKCGCRGSGWWLSELDSWHLCRFHGKDVNGKQIPHPDDDCWQDENFKVERNVYKPKCEACDDDGCEKCFTAPPSPDEPDDIGLPARRPEKPRIKQVLHQPPEVYGPPPPPFEGDLPF